MSNLEKHLISSKDCVELVNQYDASIYKEINKNRPANEPDSKSYSIDFDVLQEYMNYVNAELEKRGVAKKGIKITLGKYPERSADPKLNPEYRGYQMVFLSPVELAETGTDQLEPSPCLSRTFDDLPNLNYMGICPPSQ